MAAAPPLSGACRLPGQSRPTTGRSSAPAVVARRSPFPGTVGPQAPLPRFPLRRGEDRRGTIMHRIRRAIVMGGGGAARASREQTPRAKRTRRQAGRGPGWFVTGRRGSDTGGPALVRHSALGGRTDVWNGTSHPAADRSRRFWPSKSKPPQLRREKASVSSDLISVW